MKKLSILIAAYNLENYIDRCLSSILKQGDESLEIIVVNDGSTDKTLDIIKKYEKNDSRLIVIDKKNAGIVETRKSAYNKSTGKYIWFLDGDDWIEDKCIDKIYKYIDSNEYDLIYFDAYLAYDDKEKERLHPERKSEIYDGEEYLSRLLTGGATGSVWDKVIRKEFLESNNVEFPKNISYGDDNAMMISIGVSKPKVLDVDDAFYCYYQREGSIMNSSTKKILELKDFSEFCKKTINEKNLMEKYKDELEYYLYAHTFESILGKIFLKGSKYGKESFEIWKGLNIDIKNNKYFKEDKRIKLKLFILISKNNFKLGQIFYNIIY